MDLVGTFFGVFPEEENHTASDDRQVGVEESDVNVLIVDTKVNTIEDMIDLSDQEKDANVERPEDNVKSLGEEEGKIKVFVEGGGGNHSNELDAEEFSPIQVEDINKGQLFNEEVSDRHYREEESKDIDYYEGGGN